MGIVICIIVFFVLGIIFWIIGKYQKLKRANLNSLNRNLTSSEERKISVINNNFSHLLSVISFVIGTVLTLFFGVIPLVFPDNSLVNSNSTSSNDDITSIVTQDINTVSSEKTYETTSIETNSTLEVTENITGDFSNEENTDIFNDSENIITNDCVLEDKLTKSSNKKYYVLKTNYHSEYGFEFSIDDINLSYSFSIENEKGESVRRIDIPNNTGPYAIELNKNCTYRIIIEAKEGYPQFLINISYPENDNF